MVNKKIWSIILLCVIIALFAFTTVILYHSFYDLNYAIDKSNGEVSGVFAIIGAAVTSLSLLIGFFFLGGGVASVGFICSLVNVKIAENTVIKRISKAFLCFFSAVLILILFVFVLSII